MQERRIAKTKPRITINVGIKHHKGRNNNKTQKCPERGKPTNQTEKTSNNIQRMQCYCTKQL